MEAYEQEILLRRIKDTEMLVRLHPESVMTWDYTSSPNVFSFSIEMKLKSTLLVTEDEQQELAQNGKGA